jgi:hypothetical protein
MDWERMLLCVLHHPMDAETHNIPPGEQKRRGFSVGIRWLGGVGLHTTRSIAHIFVGVCSMSCLICMVFVADLIASSRRLQEAQYLEHPCPPC